MSAAVPVEGGDDDRAVGSGRHHRSVVTDDAGRRKRRLGLAMLLVGFVIVAAAAYLAITALLARSALQDARAELSTLREQVARGDFAAARNTAGSLAGHARDAHDLTSGPVWAVAATLPAGGGALESTRGVAAGVDEIASSVLPALIDARDQLDSDRLRRPDGAIDLQRIETVAGAVVKADTSTLSAGRAIARLPADTWLRSVDDARADLLGQIEDLRRTIHPAALAVRLLPTMLGADGTRRYFVAFQNTAEARGTGGLPGTFGILAVTNGRARFERFGSDNELDGVRSGVDLGPDFTQLYGPADAPDQFINSNVGPHFPDAARIWLAMWQRHQGVKLDGAIALDPTALSYLLGVSGPAKTPDGTTVTGDDIVSLTQSDIYRRFPDTAERRAFLRDVAAAAAKSVLADQADVRSLVSAAGRAAGERRVLLWSSHPSLQRLIAQTALAGEIPDTAAPYAGVSVVNQGGNKLDYYLDRTLVWKRSGCGAVRDVVATFTLRNEAPRSGLPTAVTSRTDRRPRSVRPGDNRTVAYFYGTSGGVLDSVTVDGKAATAQIGTDRGHPVFGVDVEIPAGEATTIVVRMREPRADDTPQVLRQPLVRPEQVRVEDSACR